MIDPTEAAVSCVTTAAAGFSAWSAKLALSAVYVAGVEVAAASSRGPAALLKALEHALCKGVLPFASVAMTASGWAL